MAEVSRIKGGGHSSSWKGQKKQAIKVMVKLLVELKDQLGISGEWDSLGQDKLALRALYEYFIGFMVRDLKKNSGGVYAPGTITKFVAIMIKAAVDKYQMNPIPAMQRLASALDNSRFTADRVWLMDLKAQVVRECFQRDNKDPDSEKELRGKRCAPLYLMHVQNMVRAYTKAAGHRSLDGDAVSRKFAILCAWLSCGRSSESLYMLILGMRWDPLYRAVEGMCPQFKVSEMKRAVFVVGENRHCCWFLALADVLAHGLLPAVGDATPSFLHPRFQNTRTPGTRLGNVMKDLTTGVGSYADFKLEAEDLPSNVSAGGLRPGAITTMCRDMPKDKAASVSGHKMPCTLETYIHEDLADMAPGIRVLSGFAPAPWGTTGPMPSAMSLDALSVDKDGCDPVKLQAFCSDMLRLEECSLVFQPGGSLWPAAQAATAALIMYYPERHDHNELPALRVKMRSVFMKIYRTGTISQAEHGHAHRRLLAWSELIKTAWKLANVAMFPLGASHGAASVASPLVKAVQRLDSRFKQRDDQHKVLVGRLTEVQESLAKMDAQLALRGGGGGGGSGGEMRVGADAPGCALPQSPSSSSAQQRPAHGAAHDAPALASPVRPSATAFFGGLMMQGDSSSNKFVLKGKTAAEVFAHCVSQCGGHAPSQMSPGDKRRVTLVLAHFSAMTTVGERNTLSGKAKKKTAKKKAAKTKSKSTPFTKKRDIVSRINQLVCARLAEAFGALDGVKMPKSLKRTMRGGRFPALKAGGIESWLAALAKLGAPKPDPDTYAEWRQKYEAAAAAEVAPEAAPAAAKKRKRGSSSSSSAAAAAAAETAGLGASSSEAAALGSGAGRGTGGGRRSGTPTSRSE